VDLTVTDNVVEGIEAMPRLTQYSLPPVSPKYVGSNTTLSFIIDVKGHPSGVKAEKSSRKTYYQRDRDLAALMIEVVKGWRFKPARNAEGQDEAIAAILDTRVNGFRDSAFARMRLKLLSAT
jgi:hypothetical protein